MDRSDYPRAGDIRAALLGRAEHLRRIGGVTLSAIGKAAVNDSAFLFQVAEGRNFTLRSYQRVMDWIDPRLARLYARQKKTSRRSGGT